MEQSPEETQQQPAGDEQQKPTAEVPPKPSRPGILKSPQSSFEPQKQVSTKTLRFQMDEPAQPLPPAPLLTTTPTPQEPASEVLTQSVPPTQDKPEESKEVRSKIDIPPPLSLGIEDSLSESHSSSTSSSLSQGSTDSASAELSESVESRAAPSTASAAVPGAPSAPMFKLLGDCKVPLWFPKDVMRYFVAPSQNDPRDAEACRLAAESGDAEEDDDSSTSALLQNVPWRPSFPQQTLMALLGVLTLVFLVSAMVRDSRRSGYVSTVKRQLKQDVAVSTINVDGNQEALPLPQMPLNDIEKLPQGRDGLDKPTASAEEDAASPAVRNEDPSEATGPTEASDSADRPKLREVLGRVRQKSSDTLRLCICRRKDPNDVRRWYFNGKQRLQWRFRPDRCPSQEGQLFTAHECRSSCTAANISECRVADSKACGPQMQGAYFAHRERKTGLFRCIGMSSIATGLNGSACLKGANRFTTMQACRKACVHAGR